MLEPGFIWYLIKSMRFPVLVFAWTYCVAYTFNPSSPEGIEKNIACVLAFAGLVYAIVVLGASIVKDKYKEYREERERAWNILKESK